MKFENTVFKRVDSDTIDKLINKDEKKESVLNEDELKTLETLYTSAIGNADFKVKC